MDMLWFILLMMNHLISGQKEIEKWVTPILKSCDDYLKNILFEKSVSVDAEEEEKLFRCVVVTMLFIFDFLEDCITDFKRN